VSDRVCVVTGVGPGTGAALVRRFAADGYRVAMLARDRDRLEQLAAEIPGAAGFPVDVADLAALRAALAQVARRFPAVRLEAGPVSRGAERAEVALQGGAGGLERMIAELVKNACEGSGAQRARRVTVSVDAESEPGSVAIRVLDDGPGFAAHVLASTPTAFVTTKPGGTGLGLYTAERLAAANGGSLRLENPPSGGSAVTLRLRRL
jgi:C4-dicarboxylate-specific signal transduction histidine kinase